MSDRSRRALALLGVAVSLGVSGDALRTWVPGRLDAALWAAVALIAATALIRTAALAAPPRAAWLGTAALLLIACLVWRDAELLFVLNAFGLLGVVGVAATGGITQSLDRLGAFDLFRGSVTLGIETAAGPMPTAVRDIAWAQVPLTGRARRLATVLAGLAVATPVILLFGSLFGQADPLFRQAISRLFGFDLALVAEHMAFAGFVAWVAAGALRGALWREGRGPGLLPTLPSGGRVPAAAVLGFLGGIGTLFALFVGFQARELFLDSAEFQALTGVTISEYARQGFFELLMVAVLTLPMLLGSDWLLARRDPAETRRFHRLTAVVLVLLALVLASAYQRMLLYRDYYGLTEQRFYALAFMTWLAVVCGWFAATVLRERRPGFVPGALVAGYAALLLLNLVNPDAVVARVNLGRAAQGAPFDAEYLASLSADAVPSILDAIGRGGVPDSCVLEGKVRRRWAKALAPTDRSGTWNLSLKQATRRLATAPTPDCTGPGMP
jgi:hypothetical protein